MQRKMNKDTYLHEEKDEWSFSVNFVDGGGTDTQYFLLLYELNVPNICTIFTKCIINICK